MSILRISPEVLLHALFPDVSHGIWLRGASYDPTADVVLLNLVGPSIPEAQEVYAEITAKRQTTQFKPYPAPSPFTSGD